MCSTSRWPTSPSSARASSPLAGPSSPRASSPASPFNATSGGRGWARCTRTCAASPERAAVARVVARAARGAPHLPRGGRRGPAARPAARAQRGVGSVELLKSQPLWANMQVTVELARSAAVTVRLRLSVCPSHASSAAETAETVLGKAELLRRALPVCAEGDASALARRRDAAARCSPRRLRAPRAAAATTPSTTWRRSSASSCSSTSARRSSPRASRRHREELGVARRQLLSQRRCRAAH